MFSTFDPKDVTLLLKDISGLVTPKPDKRLVDFAFSAYERRVTVTVRDSLGDSENG